MEKTLNEIVNDSNLTKEQKVQAINDYYENYQKSIDNELNMYLAKQWIGAGLQMGSAALPLGAGAAAGTAVGKAVLQETLGINALEKIMESGIGGYLGREALQKTLGKVISSDIGTGALDGLLGGAMYGLGNGLMEDKNVLLSTIQDASLGGVTGGLLGGVVGNTQRFFDSKNLKGYGDIDMLPENLRKQYSKDARNFYKDYNQGIKLGDIEFSNRGIQEILRWNPMQAQNLPELVNDVKKAKRLPDVPNLKPNEKPNVSHYEVYQGKNGLHYVEVSNYGRHRYYVTKDSIDNIEKLTKSIDQTTSLGTLSKPNNIINDVTPKVNPTNITKDIPVDLERALKRATPTTSWDVLKNPNDIINDVSPNLSPSNTIKETPVGTQPATNRRSNRSISGTTPADPIQTRAHEIEPNAIINDVSSNLNPISNTINPESQLFKVRIEEADYPNAFGIPFVDPLKKQEGKPTGFASPISNSGHIFTPEEIGKMTTQEFTKNESVIMNQIKNGQIQQQDNQQNFSGYKNPISGSSQIFSREDIGAMSTKEYTDNEKAIHAQIKSIGAPTTSELHTAASTGGGAVYVEPYIRADGKQVKGYYRSR